MAKSRDELFEGIDSSVTWDTGVVFNRTKGIPIDKWSVFQTKAEAETYALNNPTAYPGQIISVVYASGNPEMFVINGDGELKPVASTSVSTGEGGTVDLSNYYTKTEVDDLVALGGGSVDLSDVVNKSLYYYGDENIVPTDGKYFTITEDGAISINETTWDNSVTDVVIPYEVNGIKTKYIDSIAFINCTRIKRVIIPNGITSIRTCAFMNCDNLTSITLPDSITNIDMDAFLECGRLSNITFKGLKPQWNAINIHDSNGILFNVEITFEGDLKLPEIMDTDEFIELWNNNSDFELFAGKATEAKTMAVYIGQINANSNGLDLKADKEEVSELKEDQEVLAGAIGDFYNHATWAEERFNGIDSEIESLKQSGSGSADLSEYAKKEDITALQNGEGFVNGAIKPESTSFFEFEYASNLFNRDTVLIGRYINENGYVNTNDNYVTTDYIPIKPGDTIRRQFTYNGVRYDNTEKPNYGNFRVAAYDSDYKYIEGSYVLSAVVYTAPANTAYIRMTMGISFINNPAYTDIALFISDDPTVIPYSELGNRSNIFLRPDIIVKEENLSVEIETIKNTIEQNIENLGVEVENIKSELEEINHSGGDGGSVDLSGYAKMEYITSLQNGEGFINGAIKPESTSFFDLEYVGNLYNPEDIYREEYLTPSGTIGKNNETYFTTGYIPVTEGKTIRRQYTYNGTRYDNETKSYGTMDIAAYDSNKAFITFGDNVTHWKIPQGTEYIRVTMGKSFLPEGSYTDIALIYGDTPTVVPYIPFGTVSGVYLKKEYLPKMTVEAYLPKDIYCAVGRTIEIYNNQVCPSVSDEMYFKWDCSVGKALKRKFSIEGTEAIVGDYILSLYIYNSDFDLLWSDSTNLHVVEDNISSLSISVIGDSLSNGKPWMAEVTNLNNGISFVGTRTYSYQKDSDGNIRTGAHEGRSGWSAARYNKAGDASPDESSFKYANPFYDGSGFNWSYYVTNSLGGVSPDVVVLFLGTNGITLDPTSNGNAIKLLVDKIRDDNETIPIFVINTLYKSGQNGIGKQTSSDGYATYKGQYKYEEDMKVFNLMEYVNDILSGYTNVYTVPVALCHDSEYNYGAVETPVNPRSSVKEFYPIESVHPQSEGYYQIADIVYSVLCGGINQA